MNLVYLVKSYQKQVPYTNWSSHCKKDHADKVLNNRDANDANDMNVDAIHLHDNVQPGTAMYQKSQEKATVREKMMGHTMRKPLTVQMAKQHLKNLK